MKLEPGDPEQARIAAIPRRQPIDPEHVAALSAYFCPSGRQQLFEEQALLLREAKICGGAFAPMPVGSGKTLPCFLLAEIMGAQRPALIIPKKLFEKTQADFHAYLVAGWRVKMPRLVSMQSLWNPAGETLLNDERFDLLMIDEAQRCRHWNAMVAQIDAYKTATNVPIVAASGTFMTPRLMEWHHIIRWCLGTRAPVPLDMSTAAGWTDRPPEGFFDYVRESQGVVPGNGAKCHATISINTWTPSLGPAAQAALQLVQDTGMRPDGELLEDLEIPNVQQQLGMEFYYVWDPLPPDWWLKPRRAWNAYVRAIVQARIPGFVSASFVRHAITGALKDRTPPEAELGRELWARWCAVKDKFEPHNKPVWLGTQVLEQVVRRAAEGDPCLIWTPHVAVGDLLHTNGVRYYGANSDPESAQAQGVIALSTAAHGEGKQLQKWHRNSVLAVMGAEPSEQLMGRTHRKGQLASRVEFDWICTSEYQREALYRARFDAIARGESGGTQYKMTIADWKEDEDE